MKDYKRLTKWGINKFSQKPQADLKDKHSEPIVAITRLAELEDKIESGELVDRNAYIDHLMAVKDISEVTDKEIEFFAKHNARVRENTAAEIARLTAEVAELRARLDKAVELPYERKRLLWGDKDKETLLCPDCLTDIMGGIGDETFVVQCPNCGCFVNSAIEPIEFTAAAEARLKELQEVER